MMTLSHQGPKIEINGVKLTVGQAVTVRVAISAFITSIQNDGLGDDEHGRKMAEAYIDRAREVERMLIA